MLEGGLMRTGGTVDFAFHAAARVILARDVLEWSAMAEGAAAAPCAMTGLASDKQNHIQKSDQKKLK